MPATFFKRHRGNKSRQSLYIYDTFICFNNKARIKCKLFSEGKRNVDRFWSYPLTICGFISKTLIFSNTLYFMANQRCRARQVANFASPSWHLAKVKYSDSSHLQSCNELTGLRNSESLQWKHGNCCSVFFSCAIALDKCQQFCQA